ncbi:MAG TPA: HWE histidine kinase domain-containing protein [Xanthobacteraceae bacterium]
MSDERSFRSSAQRKAELAERNAALLKDAEFTRSVLANSTVAIKVLDLDARIEFMSAGALRALAIDDAEALIGTPWLALWRDEAPAAEALAQAKTGHTGVFEGSRRDNGKAGWWEVTVTPILGANGQPARLLVIARDVSERRLAQQSQQMMMQELHHRVKNMLAMVMAITSQSLARATTITDGRLAVEQRLMALAEAHNLLRDGETDAAGLRQIIDRAVAPYDTVPSRIRVEGIDQPLASRSALAIAMAVHELCTNAIKHGALSVNTGRVAVAWHVEDARVLWTWRESNGPRVSPPKRRGFGLRVVEASFREQLQGSIELSFEPGGLTCAVELPLDALCDAATG